MSASAYPEQLETVFTAEDGEEIFLRPIKSEDANRLVEFFESLSSESVLFRFLSPVRSLPPSLVDRLTHINYDSEIALVATTKEGGEESERFIAVARVMRRPDKSDAEFAIVVADSWQGKGVGAKLLEECLRIAAELEIEEVWGTLLRENTKMLALGRRLGFRVYRIPGTNLYEMRKKLG